MDFVGCTLLSASPSKLVLLGPCQALNSSRHTYSTFWTSATKSRHERRTLVLRPRLLLGLLSFLHQKIFAYEVIQCSVQYIIAYLRAKFSKLSWETVNMPCLDRSASLRLNYHCWTGIIGNIGKLLVVELLASVRNQHLRQIVINLNRHPRTFLSMTRLSVWKWRTN